VGVSADFDPKKDAANIKKHGVSLAEALLAARGRESCPCGSRTPRNGETMKKAYDFSKGKRGAVIPTTGKTRITIYMDDAVLKRFKAQSEKSGKGYQTLINEALKSYLGLTEQPVTQELVRKIIREELASQG
jgi:uncharacterized protein (DUF4415 family)